MVVARGFAYVNDQHNTDKVSAEMKKREMEIIEIVSGKVFFIFKRETIEDIKKELEALRSVENVSDVHLTYYSIEND